MYDWAKRVKKHHERQRKAKVEGKISVQSIRDGKIVDVTQESIVEHDQVISETEKLLRRHADSDA